MIQAQDVERLRKMEAYCTTTKCLRNCILAYFGEQAEERCGNCSNCLTEFEEKDVSDAAADVVRCIRASGQRFGRNMIAGTLLGENTAKIRNYRMDQNPAYGSQSGLGQTLVKEVIRTMLERGYLRQTEDKYALLKLTEQSDLLLAGEEPFVIRYKKEDERQSASGAKASGKKAARTADLTEKGRELFEELRRLRTELAQERSVPPYMVASDRTLRDMCLRIPLTEDEMLDVNGMGAKKMEQYGGRFLEKIRSVTGGDREGWGADPSLILSGADAVGEERGDSPTPLTEKRAKGRKEEFRLTDEILSAVRYVPETTISDFAAQINDLRDESRMKRLTVKWLTEKLMEEGCLEKKYWNGFTRTVLTEKGREAEIRAEERISSKGNPYEVFLYTEKAQRYLVELLKKKGADE